MSGRYKLSSRVACVVTAMLGGLGASASRAQTAEPSTTPLEEVTVTARKRSESLQRVPEAVVVVDSADLEKKSVNQINDVLATTPNLAISNGQDPGLAMINIRGIDQVRNGEPPVAFIVDGVQLIDSDNFSQDLYDVQSIQILKGPQGAFYGRDAVGGAIVVTTKPPTNDLEGFIKSTYGNGGELDTQLALRGPLVKDKVLFSLAGGEEHFDGLIDNVTLNRKVDFRSEQNLRARLLVLPSDDLTVDLRASYSYLDAGASYYIPIPDGNPDNTTVPVQAHELGWSRRQTRDTSLKIDYTLPFATLSSVTSYSDTRFYIHEDLLWTADSDEGIDQSRSAHGWTQEVRLTSPSEQRLRWMVGAYGMSVDRPVVTDFLLDTNGAGQLNAAFPSANVLQYETDAAGFGQINYDVLANLELTLALRYDEESRDQTDHLTGDKVSGSWSKPQPKVSLAYRWTPDLMLYGTYAVGFRSGGFNAPSPAYPLLYQPESVDSYELGFKSTLWDQRLRLEGALFYNKITDFQEFAFVGAYQGLFNLDKSHTDGGELQATWKVSEGLRLDLGLGYTNSRIDDYRLKGAQFETAIPVVPAQIVGNSLPLVWRESESLGVEYTHLLPFDSGWSMTWRTDLSSRQDMYWQIDNLAEERPRTILDMSIRAYNDLWSVMAYAKDLNNRQYDEEYFEKNWCCATNIRYPNEPRRFGVTVKRSF